MRFSTSLLLSLIPVAFASNPECIDDRLENTCTVRASTHSYRAPNLLVPEDVRGVYWIDAGPDAKGYTNPWVDLNFVQPFPDDSSKAGKFYVMDKTPGYQSWEDVNESFPYIKSLTKRTSRSEIDPSNLTITWSACFFTCGTSWETWVPLPLSSPSQKVGENEYVRQATVFGHIVAEWKGYRIIDENGEKTKFFDEMVERTGNIVVMIPE